jgi:hypothetical protein
MSERDRFANFSIGAGSKGMSDYRVATLGTEAATIAYQQTIADNSIEMI